MKNEIIKNRIVAIRRILKKKKAVSLLLTKPANVTYITGFSGDDSWALIGPRTVHLLTDSRYAEQAKSECQACKIIVRKESMAKTIAKLRTSDSVMLESCTSLGDFQTLKKQTKIRTARGKANSGQPSRSGATSRGAPRSLFRCLASINKGIRQTGR